MKLRNDNICILDGATGSELDRAGVNVDMPLWSANAILEAPEILKQVHISYLEAGAQAITANTFRTHQRTLSKVGMGHRAQELTEKAVAIARSARDEVNTDAFIFGSVAPLEDCYSPELAPNADTCEKEHSQIIKYLTNAGVDLVLIETMCSASELFAAAAAAMQTIGEWGWGMSFCLKQNKIGVLLDGNPIDEIVPYLERATFLGINCFPANQLTEQVEHLRKLTPEYLPIAAFGNVGFADENGGWVNTDAIDPNRYSEYAQEWVDAGANIVGGCCGTTPETTKSMKNNLKSN